jgi:hypothetical protein
MMSTWQKEDDVNLAEIPGAESVLTTNQCWPGIKYELSTFEHTCLTLPSGITRNFMPSWALYWVLLKTFHIGWVPGSPQILAWYETCSNLILKLVKGGYLVSPQVSSPYRAAGTVIRLVLAQVIAAW